MSPFAKVGRAGRGAAGVVSPASASALVAASTTADALVVRNLNVAFRDRGTEIPVVRGVDLTVLRGKVVGVLGESGSGKSVMCRAILALLGGQAAISGTIQVAGIDIENQPEKTLERIRGSVVGFVPQVPRDSLVPLRRVGKQMAEVLRVHGIATERSEIYDRSVELLRQVGIGDPKRVLHAFPYELSGGMCQRIGIALAIAGRPSLLIADEPTTALDVTVQAQVLELFAQLSEELDAGLLLVTHDVGVVRDVADTVVVMYAGQVVESGSVTDVLDTPRHPYTAALLGAMPSPGIARGHLLTIPGSPPSPLAVRRGRCAFAPRCAFAEDVCLAGQPVLAERGVGHVAACPVDPLSAERIPGGNKTAVPEESRR